MLNPADPRQCQLLERICPFNEEDVAQAIVPPPAGSNNYRYYICHRPRTDVWQQQGLHRHTGRRPATIVSWVNAMLRRDPPWQNFMHELLPPPPGDPSRARASGPSYQRAATPSSTARGPPMSPNCRFLEPPLD